MKVDRSGNRVPARLAFLSVLLFTMFGIAQAHAAQWIICNRTAEDLDVAIAYLHTSNQWLSEGWWTVRACGGCAKVMDLSKSDRVNHFLHATTRSGEERVGGNDRFCVSSHAKGAPPWTGRSGRTCGGDFELAGFALHVVDSEDKDFTTTLRGQVAGRTCTD